MKNWRKARVIFLGIILLAVSGPALARSSGIEVIQAKEVVPGDRFATGQIITNEGIIKGDLIVGGQNISSTGTVEGDVIGAGQDVSLSGNVLGNVRVGGATISLTGQAGKNVTLFGGAISLARSSVVNGSVTAFGGSISLDGKIKGRTLVGGRNVVLGGEFFGDVDVNNFAMRGPRFRDFGMSRFRFRDRHPEAKLIVLPGTIIHGVLRFRGASADIQKGAQVADFQWIKPEIAAPERHKSGIYWYVWKSVRLLFTTAVYFLMSLLLLKLFPAFFGRSAEFAAQKPWSAIGHGVIGLFSGIAVAIACILLLVLSFIMSPAFGIVSGIAATAFYGLFFFLAIVPAALWLGGLMFKERSLAYRLGAGVIALNVGLFILAMLGTVSTVGPVFSTLGCLVRFCVVLLGGGALLRALWEGCAAAKRGHGSGVTT
jgi:hypothetical protein